LLCKFYFKNFENPGLISVAAERGWGQGVGREGGREEAKRVEPGEEGRREREGKYLCYFWTHKQIFIIVNSSPTPTCLQVDH
jgi:hypothetical protein